MGKGWYLIFTAVLIWSIINPKDYPTWALEVSPALIALVILIWTAKRFPLTPLVYKLILFHCVILMVGGHYTYAEVPLFDYLGELFGWQRNHYDKLGHFVQGFVPAIVAREILIRRQVVKDGAWLFFIIVCICLAISAFYEMLEWWVAVYSEEAAEAFLGTQGYVWDTQSDMAWATFGAVVALMLLKQTHDRQIDAITHLQADSASADEVK
jgi:putative membrane protein